MPTSIYPSALSTSSDNWVQISSVTPTNGASTVSFTSISGYKKLMLRINNISTGYSLTFNSDTGSNYSFSYLQYTSSTFSGRTTQNNTSISVFSSGSSSNSAQLTINETNTTGIKNLSGFGEYVSGVSYYLPSVQGSYFGSAAITTVTLTTGSGTYTATGTVTLYGVAA
jgi:hypothetical protein